MMPNKSTGARGTQLVNLPFDVLRYIHDRLTLVDYMSFRSVSKLCREVAPALEMRTAIARSEIQSNYISPWLISFHENRRICRFNHPHSVDRYSVELPEALQGATGWYCKDGWLLIGKQRGDDYYLSFFNPFTKNVISYPEFSKINNHCTIIAFSSPPPCQNSVIAVLVDAPLDILEVHISHSREKVWRFFQFHSRKFCATYEHTVFANGAFYFGSYFKSLGVLRLQGEGCDWKILDYPRELFPLNYIEHFLTERDENVFIVLTYDQEQSVRVRVLKLDPSTMSWKMVENLENYTLHVSIRSSLSTIAKKTEAKNRIYFHTFDTELNASYSLSNNSFQSYGYKDLPKSYQDTTGIYYCGWIKPALS